MTATLEQPGTATSTPAETSTAIPADEIAPALQVGPTTTLEAARQGRPEEAKILGFEVSWNVSGLLISRDELLLRLKLAGFAEYGPSREPSAKRSARRALTEWAESRDKSGTRYENEDAQDKADTRRRKKLIREVSGVVKAAEETATPTVLALVEERSLGPRLELKYATSLRVKLIPPAQGQTEYVMRVSTEGSGAIGDWEAREEERLRVAAELAPLWEKHKQLYTGGDVSAMLIGIVHGLNGISVEAGSGVYSIPAMYEAEVDRLERFARGLGDLKETGERPHLRVRENIDWPRTRAALADAAYDTLMSEVRDAEATLERYEGQNKLKPGSVKPTTVRGLVEEMLRIRSKAAFYAETTGLRQERVEVELNRVSRRARGLIVANREARQDRLADDANATAARVLPTSALARRGTRLEDEGSRDTR